MILGNPLLQDDRIKLTAIHKSDMDTILAWYDDTEMARLFDSTPVFPKTREIIESWFDMKATMPLRDYMFAIRLRTGKQRMVGMIGLDGIMWTNGTSSLGIVIGNSNDRGQGYGRSAMRLLADFAFRELNLHRLHLTVFAYNTPAIRLYESLGYKLEGTYREHLHRDGKRWDMHHYGLLRQEWEDQR